MHLGRIIFCMALLGAASMLGIYIVKREVGPVMQLPTCTDIRLSRTLTPLPGALERTFEGAFEISNRGNADLEFSITATCSCSSLNPQQGRVRPGKSQRIVAAMTLAEPGLQHGGLLVTTNDPRTATARLRLSAEWTPPISVRPSQLDFANVLVGTAVSRELDVDVTGSDVTAVPLDARLETSEHLCAEWAPDRRKLHVTLSSDCPRGLYTGSLTVFLDALSFRLEIPVSAFAQDELHIAPSIVEFTREGTPGDIRPLRIVVQHCQGAAFGKLISHDLPPGLTLTEVASPNSLQRCFEITGCAPEALDQDIHLLFEAVGSPAMFRARSLAARFSDDVPP